MKNYKTSFLLIYFILLSFSNINSQTTSWFEKSNFSGVYRPWAISFSIGDKGYLGTGGNNSNYTNDFWEYDPEEDVWTQKANVGGQPRASAVGFSIENRGYVGLGNGNSNTLNDFWEYNPETNTWTQKSIFPGQCKVKSVGFSIGDKGYLGTGASSSTIGFETNEFWEFDPSANSWTQKAHFGGEVRGRAVGFSIGERGFIGTGYHYNGSASIGYNDFWEYNPLTDTWVEKAAYPGEGLHSCAGFSMGNYGYIGMGYLYNTDFWRYDPNTNVWTQILYFEGEGRLALTSCSINNKGYVGLGYKATSNGTLTYNDWWEFSDSLLSIDEYAYFSSALKLFPNPVRDYLNIKFIDQNIEVYRNEVCDLQGKTVIKSQNNPLNVIQLSKGTYFLKAHTSKGVFIKKFIKE